MKHQFRRIGQFNETASSKDVGEQSSASFEEQETLTQPVLRQGQAYPEQGASAGAEQYQQSAFPAQTPFYQPPANSPGQVSGMQGQPVQSSALPPLSQPLPDSVSGLKSQPLQPFMFPGMSNALPASVEPVYKPVKQRRPKRHFPLWIRIAVVVFVIFLLIGGVGAYYYQTNIGTHLSNITGQTTTRLEGKDAATQGRGANAGTLNGRMNILLLGSDDDQKTLNNNGLLAQTDIVVSINGPTKQVTMFSFPRDGLVKIPGHGIDKLDKAFLFGAGAINQEAPTADNVKDGARLSMDTIYQNFGIYIDHYAWVGLTGFTKVIHTVGGVDVNVTHPITDDLYPDDTGNPAAKNDVNAVKRLYLAPGPQHLTDLQALEYVRSRHADLNGDFGRSARQQQVLNQLKAKLNNPDTVNKLPELAADLDGSVLTDMQTGEVINLVNFARGIEQNKIERVTLNGTYSQTYDAVNTSNEDKTSVVVLNCDTVQPKIAQVFQLGNKAKCTRIGISTTVAANGVPDAIELDSTSSIAPEGLARIALSRGNNLVAYVSHFTMIGEIWNSGNDYKHLVSVRSLLDIMFTIVCESPAALTT